MSAGERIAKTGETRAATAKQGSDVTDGNILAGGVLDSGKGLGETEGVGAVPVSFVFWIACFELCYDDIDVGLT